MVPVLRTMQGVPAVRPRVHPRMERDLMVTARVLRTQANPVVLRMVPFIRTMQSVPAVRPKRLSLLTKESQEDGAVKTRPSPRRKNIASSLTALGWPPEFFRDLDLTEAILAIVF